MSDDYKIISLAGTDPALAAYTDYLFVTYLKSLRFGNDFFREIDSDTYYAIHHQLLENTLKKPDVVVKLAVLPDDPDIVISWALIEKNVLHYVHTKANIEARKLGIAKSLIPEGIDTITHLTKIGLAIFKKYKNKIKFNPYYY